MTGETCLLTYVNVQKFLACITNPMLHVKLWMNVYFLLSNSFSCWKQTTTLKWASINTFLRCKHSDLCCFLPSSDMKQERWKQLIPLHSPRTYSYTSVFLSLKNNTIHTELWIQREVQQQREVLKTSSTSSIISLNNVTNDNLSMCKPNVKKWMSQWKTLYTL